jgi:hypothetical protein
MNLFLLVCILFTGSGCSLRQKLELSSNWKREVRDINLNYKQSYTIGKCTKISIESGLYNRPYITNKYNRNEYNVKTSIEW